MERRAPLTPEPAALRMLEADRRCQGDDRLVAGAVAKLALRASRVLGDAFDVTATEERMKPTSCYEAGQHPGCTARKVVRCRPPEPPIHRGVAEEASRVATSRSVQLRNPHRLSSPCVIHIAGSKIGREHRWFRSHPALPHRGEDRRYKNRWVSTSKATAAPSRASQRGFATLSATRGICRLKPPTS
jgi:hypothetical protein